MALGIDLSNDQNLVVAGTVVVRKNDLSCDQNLGEGYFSKVQTNDLSNGRSLGEEYFSKYRMNDLFDQTTIVPNQRMRVDWTEKCLDLCFHVPVQGQNLEPTRRLCKSQGHQGLIVGEGFSYAFNRYDELLGD